MAASACCRLLPHSQRLLRLDGLWYLDAERAEVGLLEAAAEETHWLDLPPLKHEHGRRLRSAPAAAVGWPRGCRRRRCSTSCAARGWRPSRC